MTRWPTLALVGSLLGALLGGCGQAGEPLATGLPVHTLRVGLVEWAITVQHRPLAPGLATFLVTNAGTTAHDLRVSGPGGAAQSALLAPGRHARLQLNVRPDERLDLSCTVPGHEAQGMHTHLTVTKG